MKALAITDYGLDRVDLMEVPDPEPGPGEVLVRLRAAALNHLDLWTVSGSLRIQHEMPHVLGADGAGEIEGVGPGVEGLRSGSRVMINPGISCRSCELCRQGEHSTCTTFRLLGEHLAGTFAERVVVPAANVFPIPEHLSFEEAAGLGVTYATAYRMLFTRGRMRPGEWVLITGIGGGLALSLFQLARPVAGRIYVTSSSKEKLERALEMGADGALNYREEEVDKGVRQLTGKRGVDLVVDSAGGESLDPLVRSLRKGGRLVVAGGTAGGRSQVDLRRVFWNQIDILGSTMGSDRDVSDMLRMVAGTGLRPIIDRSFDLAEGREAVSYLQSQQHFGKVVLRIP